MTSAPTSRRGVPRGLLSLLAPLWATAFLTAGVWLAAGTAAGLATLGVVGTVAMLAAEWVLDDPAAPEPEPRALQVERRPPTRQIEPAREPLARRVAAHLRRLGALVPRPRLVRARYLLAGAVAALLAAMLVLLAVQTPAQAESSTDGNPWSMTMDGAGDGLVLTGDDGPELNQILYAQDHLLQPVAGIGEHGGLWAAGDCISDFAGFDILHAQISICPDGPNPDVCVRNGQLWIGGPDGRIWRCADLDGGAWNGAWWLAV